MANSYTQLYVQLVFAVSNRQCLISEENRISVEKYICGIITNNKSKVLSIYCNPDHIHILVGLNPMISVSSLVNKIKSNSSKWINSEKIVRHKFNWQDGYGAFSYAKSEISTVAKYIENQPIHHMKTSFKDEYLKILNKHDITYNYDYLFDWINE